MTQTTQGPPLTIPNHKQSKQSKESCCWITQNLLNFISSWNLAAGQSWRMRARATFWLLLSTLLLWYFFLLRGNARHCVLWFRCSGQLTNRARHLSSDAGQLSRRAKANQALPTIALPFLQRHSGAKLTKRWPPSTPQFSSCNHATCNHVTYNLTGRTFLTISSALSVFSSQPRLSLRSDSQVTVLMGPAFAY